MHVQSHAPEAELGFWGELLSTALQAGASVYGTKQQAKLQTAQLKAQTEQLRQQMAAQEKANELQAKIALAQQQAAQAAMQPMPVLGQGVPATPRSYGVPVYDVQFAQPGALPSWALPAAIGGGALVLLLLMRRR